MKNLNNVSLLKIVAMLFIFAFHCVLAIAQDVQISHMYFPLYFGIQIFMFISGYLYSNKQIPNFKSHILKRLGVILIPYYIFMILLFIVYLIVNPAQITLPVFLKSIFCIQFYSGISSLGHFWYILYALICYLFVPILIYKRWLFREKTKQNIKDFIIYFC